METVENIKESVLNKYFKYVGDWNFVSNATRQNEDPKFYQDAESLGYVLLYGVNKGKVERNAPDAQNDSEKPIELKEKSELHVSYSK